MDAQTAIGDIIDKDSRRREQILTVCEDIKKILQRDEYLRHIMTTEIEDVTQDLDKLRCAITCIKDIECPILVAGETSAGKSSMINLIIGKQILPERLLSSTSTICKIWNSEEKKIVLTDLQNIQKPHTFDSDDYIDKMKSFLIQNVGSGSDNNPWKSADIYLPVPVLQEKKRIRNKLQPSSNYQNLVQGIRDMMPKSLEAKLIRHVKKSVLAKVDEKCKAIAKEIVDHLNAVKEDMFMWNEFELLESKDIQCLTAKATELIKTAINNEINRWSLIRTHEIDSELGNILERDFKIIEGDLKNAGDCFGSFTGYTSENMHVWNTLSLLTNHFNLGNGAAIVTSPLLFCGIIGFSLYLREIIPSVQNYDLKNKSAIEKYTTDKMKFMRKWADSILERKITEKQIYTQMEPFMKNMNDKIRLKITKLEHCDDSLYYIVMVKRKPTACGSFQTLKDCKTSWTFVLGIMEGLCLALDYIHNKGFVHRDVNLANVMVKGECNVRLADFGLSKKQS
ncbi:unnamed protein product [Mytilus coruscus]|uniref:Protein kinase domain-containing protein n=1 Tax=Mytilus coruscus TaxID=42192 RepID=A0A6J8ADV4_MYTCO|nr:unnamed protein product [Mytilus coruscus]